MREADTNRDATNIKKNIMKIVNVKLLKTLK